MSKNQGVMWQIKHWRDPRNRQRRPHLSKWSTTQMARTSTTVLQTGLQRETINPVSEAIYYAVSTPQNRNLVALVCSTTQKKPIKQSKKTKIFSNFRIKKKTKRVGRSEPALSDKHPKIKSLGFPRKSTKFRKNVFFQTSKKNTTCAGWSTA